MRRSQTGLRPVQGRKHHKLGLERLEERALMAATITEFPVPTQTSQPYGIVSGSDGRLWFTEATANNVASITPGTGAVSEFPTLTMPSAPLTITAGPAGTNTLYFTENSAGKIGSINLTNDSITEYPIPVPTTGGTPAPFGITLGSDGNIWFTDQNATQNAIGKLDLTTSTPTITEIPTPTATGNVAGITTGSDGNLWFTETAANQIGMLNPTNPSAPIVETAVPTSNSAPFGITSGPNGTLWFTEESANQIASFVPGATITINEYPIPTPGSVPFGITQGADGNLWFTEQSANQIGRISPTSHAVQEFTIPTVGSTPNLITSGPDSALWFTEGTGNQIGRLAPDQILQATGTTISGNAGTAFTGIVASFTSASVNPQASQYSATIAWGDGTTTSATAIAPNSTGTGFNVAGTHTYAAQGTYALTVTITDTFGDTATTTSTANIAGPVTPPVNGPIPTVTSLVRTGIHRQPTQIILTFSSALNPLQAQNALNYSIVGLGPDNKIDSVDQVAAGQADDQYIHVLTAVYNASANTVTLTTYEHLSLSQLYQITVHSGPSVETANGLTPIGLQSPLGVFLAGVNNTPGTDFVETFRGGIVPQRTVRIHPRPVRAHMVVPHVRRHH